MSAVRHYQSESDNLSLSPPESSVLPERRTPRSIALLFILCLSAALWAGVWVMLHRAAEILSNIAGAALTEFALIFPLLLFTMIGAIDLGVSVLDSNLLNFASEAAARCSSTANPQCTTPAATASYAASVAPGLPGVSASNFTVSMASCGTQVQASFPYPAMFLPSFTISASACYP